MSALALAGLASVGACVVGITIREPVIALLFQRGSFTADSTRLVSAVFLGFAPSLIGWTLLELTARSLFAMDRPWLPLAASTIPALFNLVYLLSMRNPRPEFLGLGASLGFLCAFALLFALTHAKRVRWLAAES
jgi:putative peptidoglycan lipid II flippase